MKKVLLVLLFLARLWLAVHAKHGDMYNNLDWGQGAATHQLAEFYDCLRKPGLIAVPTSPQAVFSCIWLHTS